MYEETVVYTHNLGAKNNNLQLL